MYGKRSEDNTWTLEWFARIVGGTISGDGNTPIEGVGGADTADYGDLVFAENPKFLDLAIKSRAAAVITKAELAQSAIKPLILVAEPRLAFLKALEAFSPSAD